MLDLAHGPDRTDAQWRALAAILQRDELAPLTVDARRVRCAEIDALIAAWTCDRTPEDVQVGLQAAGVAAHDVQNSAQCLADPQLAHRQHFRRVPHSVHGEAVVEGPNAAYSRTSPYPTWAGPSVGQHTDEVLRDILGYDDDTITQLVIAGAIT